MKWEESITQHDLHYSQPIAALRGSCMIIQRDVSGAWQGIIPIGDILVALRSETADDAKREAAGILRDRLRHALAEVNAGTPTQGPVNPSPSELIESLFHTIVDGDVVSTDPEDPDGPKPTHIVVDPDGDLVGSGRSADAAKADAICRTYNELKKDYDALRAQVRSLRDAARELFGL